MGSTVRHEDPVAACIRTLDAAQAKGYARLKADHEAEYQRLFGRVQLGEKNMKRRMIPFAVALGSVCHAAENPNLVFMMADDLTYRDIGCYGGQAHTPNIDQLAGEGMRFTRCFQTAPMCSPTRHSIYTGQYPVKSGAYPNHTRVNPGVKSIVQYLGDLGYRVAQSGKTHVAPDAVFAWEKIPGRLNPELDKVDAFLADAKTDDKPFCLLLCWNEPHAKWDKGDASRYPADKVKLPPYYVDTPETRDGFSRYLAEITYFDGQVGEALNLLEKHGLDQNTLVVVLSEHGNSLPFAKWTCYDSGLQSAFIARWPGKINPGSVNPAMIDYVDILPTFIEAAGGKPDPSIDGKSLLPVFAGKQEHRQFVYGAMTTRGINQGSEYFGIRSVRSERFKYIWNFTPEIEFKNVCTESKEFKSWIAKAAAGDEKARELVKKYQFRPGIELYDIVNDPLEMNNLADNPEHAPVIKELRAELERWMAHCGDLGQATEMNALKHMPKHADKD
jgi:N-sulfoglucosamine sulfohydrolase